MMKQIYPKKCAHLEAICETQLVLETKAESQKMQNIVGCIPW